MKANAMRSDRTIGAVALAASLIPVVTGLGASVMLAVDAFGPRPVFCAEGGACDAVRQTVFSAPLGIPLPTVGLAGFVAIGLAALLPGRSARTWQLALGALAGLLGLCLLVVQATLHTFCPYCCVADASGVAAAAVSAWRFARARADRPVRMAAVAGVVSLGFAVALPLAMGFWAQTSTGLPGVIRQEMEGAHRGVVTLVDFVDFECPFCRRMHAVLAPLVEKHAKRIRVLRRQVPLRSHPHALDAARAACCGERLGKGDAMADALFTAPVDDLTPSGCEELAVRLGLPRELYRACVADPKTDERIQADRAEFKAAGGRVLPTLWIGETAVVGAQAPEVLERAIDDALRQRPGG
ncbi:MAG: thioredoxin domain-containing protein [Polyangiaceae bacterium]